MDFSNDYSRHGDKTENFKTLESMPGERISQRVTTVQTVNTEVRRKSQPEKLISLKGGYVRKSEMMDFGKGVLKGKNHSQWLKDLNNSIKDRIASQLSQRNRKEVNNRSSVHMVDFNL